MTTFIVAGSFNPFHNGHAYLIDQCLLRDDIPTVVIQASNSDKKKSQEVEAVIRSVYQDRVGFLQLPANTLLADFVAGNFDHPILCRGYRNDTDLAYEESLEQFNLAQGVGTFLMKSPQELRNCSSSTIRALTGPGNVGFHNLIRPLMPEKAYLKYLEDWIGSFFPEFSLREIFDRYREGSRHYHNLEHIAHTLQELNRISFCTGLTVSGLHKVAVALLFHDAVYDPTRSDNESWSATLMKSHAAHSDPSLVMATAGHEPSSRLTEITVVACDLAILGRSPIEYQRYAEQIRKEYSFVPEKIYRQERTKVLTKLLEYRFPQWWPDRGYNKRLVTNINAEIHTLGEE
jgi:predicted metal-dependent HD superfamily phosphohydrolase/phosphopantetheine adenylyltransferase